MKIEFSPRSIRIIEVNIDALVRSQSEARNAAFYSQWKWIKKGIEEFLYIDDMPLASEEEILIDRFAVKYFKGKAQGWELHFSPMGLKKKEDQFSEIESLVNKVDPTKRSSFNGWLWNWHGENGAYLELTFDAHYQAYTLRCTII
jgi:hypothetical protein